MEYAYITARQLRLPSLSRTSSRILGEEADASDADADADAPSSSSPPKDEIRIVNPKPEHFASIAALKSDAFREEEYCCVTSAEVESEYVGVYARYNTFHPDKLKRCGVAVRGAGDGEVIGCIQLTFGPSDCGDLSVPAWMRRKLSPTAAYVDFIAVKESGRGMGLGVRLLDWAAERTRAEGGTSICLDVASDRWRAIPLAFSLSRSFR